MSVSAEEFSKSDAQLAADKAFASRMAKYGVPASEASVAAAVKALEGKQHTVKVFESGADATAFLSTLLKEGVTVSAGHSTTLIQIGATDMMKANTKARNFKSEAIAAMEKGDMATYGKLLAQGATADVFVSSASAVTEDGDIYGVDLTGSRISGWIAAGQLVVVVGSNKIVKDAAAANDRIENYSLALESARVRVAYKVPASAIKNRVVINGANPYGSRVTVVIVKQALGF